MKKTILLYSLLVIAIPCLAFVGNIEFTTFSMIHFTKFAHVIYESINLILLLAISLSSHYYFKQTNDERFLILSYGILIGLLFNIVHVLTAKTFPFDNLSLMNMKKNPSLLYLFLSNLIIPLSINFALIYKPFSISNAKIHIKYFYTYLFIILAFVPVAIYYIFPHYINSFFIVVQSSEYVSYALYFMIAAILINIKTNKLGFTPDTFIIGLLFLGFSGVAYINPGLTQISGIFGHLFQNIGFLFILMGLAHFEKLSKLYTLKDELVSYLSLLIILFYIALVPVISAIFNIAIPKSSGYIFIEILLIFQLVIYIISSIFWKRVVGVYLSAESNGAIVRIMESINRISEPNIVKNTIISEINRIYHPDKSIIVIYNDETNSFYLDEYAKFLPSKTLLNSEDVEHETNDFNNFQSIFKNIEINFSTLNEYLQRISGYGSEQEQWLKNHRIKSLYTIPINDNEKLLGYIILYFIKESYALSKEDYNFLQKVASLLGGVIKNNL